MSLNTKTCPRKELDFLSESTFMVDGGAHEELCRQMRGLLWRDLEAVFILVLRPTASQFPEASVEEPGVSKCWAHIPTLPPTSRTP